MAEYTENLCVGGTVDAIGSDYGRIPELAFNGTNTSWSTDCWERNRPETPVWISYELLESKIVTKLVLYYPPDPASNVRMPKDFDIQGSISGVSDWVTIATLSAVDKYDYYVPAGDPDGVHDQGSSKEYIFPNTVAYKGYRLYIRTTLYGTQNAVAIGEIEMMAEAITDINPDRPDNITELYNLSYRGNLRGKASQGLIRPTVKQFFTSENFEEITADITRTAYLEEPEGFQDASGMWFTHTSSDDATCYAVSSDEAVFNRSWEVTAPTDIPFENAWIKIDFKDQPKNIKKLALGGWDASGYPTYLLPATFEFQASNDDETWKTLVEGSTLVNRPTLNSWQYIDLGITGTYRYYRIANMTPHLGSAETFWICIGSWMLLETEGSYIQFTRTYLSPIPEGINTVNSTMVHESLPVSASVQNVSNGNFERTWQIAAEDLPLIDQFISIDLGTEKEIVSLGLAGWDASGYPAYILPNTFKFYGSNDNTNWTLLLEGITLVNRPTLNSWQYIDLTNTGSYRYYKIADMTSTYTSQTWIVIGGWQLFE